MIRLPLFKKFAGNVIFHPIAPHGSRSWRPHTRWYEHLNSQPP